MKRLYLVFKIIILTGFAVQAQLVEIPIEHPVAQGKSSPLARTESDTPIELPFWDDFSTSNGILDTAWWMPGSQAQVLSRTGNGILPPTLNVVTFDGVDAQGIPYSVVPETDGPADSLLSRYIDLTTVPTDLKSSVYLSFFFQVKGNGNQPEPEDSLILYFKKADSTWQKMWPLANDIIPSDPTIFTEELINVPNSEDFFHDHFQFMFQAYGRQNGWFDNWNVDYVYMDKRRTSNDNSYLDRALTDLPTSFLGQYTAMPFNEFIYNADPGKHLTSSSTWIRTLENDTQPVQYTATIRDTLNDVLIETIANDVELIMFPKDLKSVSSLVPSPGSFDQTADSLFLEIEYFVKTGDKNLIDSIYNVNEDTAFYDHINLRVNDTARTYITIHDYFAYDDGSAEYGAGINQKEGRIAYEYVSNTPQYIDRLDIYFPNISRNQVGTPLEVFILKDLKDVQSEYEGLSTVSIQHDGINEFSSYFFSKSVFVQDTFYIGFVNKAQDELWTAVGLDKNTDTGDKIYYTIENSLEWTQNTEIEGSLMMRPHFIDKLVSGIEIEEELISVYPNPNSGRFQLQGSFNSLRIIDLQGKEQHFTLTKSGVNSTVLLNNPKTGVYILQVQSNGKLISSKLIINN